MTRFAKYDDAGRILFTGDVPEEMVELQGENVYVGAIDGATQYVVAGKIAERPRNRAVLVGRELANLPVPCQIQINGTTYDCVDGRASLNFAYPGTYRIRITGFPCLDAEFEIQA